MEDNKELTKIAAENVEKLRKLLYVIDMERHLTDKDGLLRQIAAIDKKIKEMESTPLIEMYPRPDASALKRDPRYNDAYPSVLQS